MVVEASAEGFDVEVAAVFVTAFGNAANTFDFARVFVASSAAVAATDTGAAIVAV